MRLSRTLLVVLLAAGSAFAQPAGEAELRKEAGNYFVKVKQWESARDQYLAALKLDETYADAHYNLGVVYFFRLQDYPRALHHLVRYAQLKPDAPDSEQVKGLAVQALEKVEALEREEYRKALDQGTPAALEGFVAAYPLSPYAADAKEKLRLLREHEERLMRLERESRAAYEEALAARTPEALDAFLQAHPGAPQEGEARRLRDEWAARRAEEERAYQAALAERSPAALERFLEERPGSPLAARARVELERFRAGEEAFRIAAEARSVPALEVFLATHAGSPREAEARALLDRLRREAGEREAAEAEERAFRAAAEARSVGALEGFLAANPDGAHAAEARSLLDGLRREEAARKAEEAAEQALRSAMEARSIPALEAFLATHRDAPQASKARAALEELRREEEARRERDGEAARRAEAEKAAVAARQAADRAWAEADAHNTAEGYREFRGRYPAHPMAEEARRREAVLEAAAPSKPAAVVNPPPPAPAPEKAPAARPEPKGVEADWAKAQEKDTLEAYEAFLRTYPEGDEARAARSRLEELRAPAPETGGSLPREKRQSLDRYRRMLQNQ